MPKLQTFVALGLLAVSISLTYGSTVTLTDGASDIQPSTPAAPQSSEDPSSTPLLVVSTTLHDSVSQSANVIPSATSQAVALSQTPSQIPSQTQAPPLSSALPPSENSTDTDPEHTTQSRSGGGSLRYLLLSSGFLVVLSVGASLYLLRL